MPAYASTAVDFQGGAGRLAGDRWSPDGPSRGVVLLLHGGGQTRHSWREAGPTLAHDGWTAIAIDFRGRGHGHGDSDRAADGRYRIDAMAEDVLAVIDAIGEPPVIIGASLGGLAGLVIAGEHPAALRALVLVDSVLRCGLGRRRRGPAGHDPSRQLHRRGGNGPHGRGRRQFRVPRPGGGLPRPRGQVTSACARFSPPRPAPRRGPGWAWGAARTPRAARPRPPGRGQPRARHAAPE